MTTQIEELKRLALLTKPLLADDSIRRLHAFYAAVSPDVVLGLIAQNEELVEALRESCRIVQDSLDAFGPCDHSVGICNCDMEKSIQASDAALAKVGK
jgi:hypothetical protein